MNILITGANGFIGKALVRKLKKSHHVTSLVHNKKAQKNEICIDITKPHTLKSIPDKIDVVIHLAAKLMGSTYEQPYYDVNVKGTRNLLKECKHVKRFIYMSSAAVYSGINQSENDIPKPHNIYGRSKLLAEKHVKKYANNYTILRPGMVYGPGDVRVLKLFKAAQSKFFPLIGGNHLIQPIFIDDCIDAIEIAIDKKVPNVMNIAHPDILFLREFISLIGNPFFVPFPKMICYAGNCVDVMEKIVHKDLKFNSSRLRFLSESRTYNVDILKKFKKDFISHIEGVKRTLV